MNNTGSNICSPINALSATQGSVEGYVSHTYSSCTRNESRISTAAKLSGNAECTAKRRKRKNKEHLKLCALVGLGRSYLPFIIATPRRQHYRYTAVILHRPMERTFSALSAQCRSTDPAIASRSGGPGPIRVAMFALSMKSALHLSVSLLACRHYLYRLFPHAAPTSLLMLLDNKYGASHLRTHSLPLFPFPRSA